jgi:hypothetical protein
MELLEKTYTEAETELVYVFHETRRNMIIQELTELTFLDASIKQDRHLNYIFKYRFKHDQLGNEIEITNYQSGGWSLDIYTTIHRMGSLSYLKLDRFDQIKNALSKGIDKIKASRPVTSLCFVKEVPGPSVPMFIYGNDKKGRYLLGTKEEIEEDTCSLLNERELSYYLTDKEKETLKEVQNGNESV